MIVVQGQPKLFEVVDTLRAPGRFTGCLNGRQQDRQQNTDDRYDHQKFHKSKSDWFSVGSSDGRTLFRNRHYNLFFYSLCRRQTETSLGAISKSWSVGSLARNYRIAVTIDSDLPSRKKTYPGTSQPCWLRHIIDGGMRLPLDVVSKRAGLVRMFSTQLKSPWGQITPPNRNMQSWRDLRTSGEHIFG